MNDAGLKAVAFDLGDTLVEYEGVPLNWEAHYPAALGRLSAYLGINTDSEQLGSACGVLRRYNTRIHPREKEISFAVLLGELLACLEVRATVDELGCARALFEVFRKRLRCFPEARSVIDALRQRGLRLGVFTDVPYGMPSELVLEDIARAGLTDAFDVLLTSSDVGFRKPSIATLSALASRLDCQPHQMIHVGNERKDVDVARALGCPSVLLDRSRHGAVWGQHRTIASLSEL